MGLFDFLSKRTSGYADSSSIPVDERQYYQPDNYYTFYSYPNTSMQKKVITFEERKKISYASKRGLYVAEILLLHYCSKGQYPNPKRGYPGLWWFEYGIRDVGGKLRELETKGFLIMNHETGKYHLTDMGTQELQDNAYIPYIHNSRKKTMENSPFGQGEFNVWSVNKLIHDNPNVDSNVLLKEAEKSVTTDLDTGIDAEEKGDIESAISFYEKQVSERFDGSNPYNRLAIIYRRRKQYDKEIEVLEKAIQVFSSLKGSGRPDVSPKLQGFKERLEKAKALKDKQ